MQIIIRMADERLAGFVENYGYWDVAMENIATSAPGLIGFNLFGAHVEIDGEVQNAPVLMGIANDPTRIHYTIRGGPVLTLRCRSSIYDRLLGIDLSKESGLVVMDREKHPKIASIHDRLKTAQPEPDCLFKAMEEAVLALLPGVAPPGLIERFVELVSFTDEPQTVSGAADKLNCTVRTLERACRRRYGRTPGRLLRGMRLYRTLEMEKTAQERIELSADFAYSDLPHYLNDLRRISGLTRTEIQEQVVLNDQFPYRYEFSGGRAAVTAEDIEAWRDEMERRARVYPG